MTIIYQKPIHVQLPHHWSLELLLRTKLQRSSIFLVEDQHAARQRHEDRTAVVEERTVAVNEMQWLAESKRSLRSEMIKSKPTHEAQF